MNSPHTHSALSNLDKPDRALLLLLLNGLSSEAIVKLTPAAVDFTQHWIQVDDGLIPLTHQSADALQGLELKKNGTWFTPQDIEASGNRLPLSENDAHARLAGAIWFTSDEGRLIRETGGFTLEAPILPLAYTYPFSIIGRLQPDSPFAAPAQAVIQKAMDWLSVELLRERPLSRLEQLRSLLFSGRIIFLVVSTGVNGINFLYNLVIGRLLTPADYGQITLIITLQLLVSLIPSVIQTVSARFSATYHAREDFGSLSALVRFGRTWSWRIGLISFAVLLLATFPLAHVFQIARPELLIPIVLATPMFVLMGIDRGILQGTGRYFWLSGAYLSEGLVRFGAGVGLALILAVSARIDGAAWGLGQAMLVTWFVSWLALRHFKLDKPRPVADEQKAWLGLLGLVTIGLLGQALITNSDFMLVKSLFSSAEAGQYAAVTVLGRIAYFGATPLTLLMLPAVARQQALGLPTRPILLKLLVVVGVFTGALLFASWLFAPQILGLLYGEAYLPAATLLPTYTVAASLFVLANVGMTYRIALNAGGSTWFLLAGGIAQIVGILLFHTTLQAVILVQIVIMLLLVVGVGWDALRRAG